MQSWALSLNPQNPQNFGHAGACIYDLSVPIGRQEAEIGEVPETQSQLTWWWEQNKDPVLKKVEDEDWSMKLSSELLMYLWTYTSTHTC